ncbi:putative aldehyde dehydrogenase [Ixodes scapularis]
MLRGEFAGIMAPNRNPPVKFTQIFINNEFVNSVSGKTFPTYNPATGKKIADVQEADKARSLGSVLQQPKSTGEDSMAATRQATLYVKMLLLLKSPAGTWLTWRFWFLHRRLETLSLAVLLGLLTNTNVFCVYKCRSIDLTFEKEPDGTPCKYFGFKGRCRDGACITGRSSMFAP